MRSSTGGFMCENSGTGGGGGGGGDAGGSAETFAGTLLALIGIGISDRLGDRGDAAAAGARAADDATRASICSAAPASLARGGSAPAAAPLLLWLGSPNILSYRKGFALFVMPTSLTCRQQSGKREWSHTRI